MEKVIFYTVDMRLNPQDEHQVLVPCMLPWSEENEALACAAAYDGHISVEEMEVSEMENAPTLETRVTSLEASNAEMTETLDMILSGVTSDA